MRINVGFTFLALALIAAPLSAQGKSGQARLKGRGSRGTVVRTSDGTVTRSTSDIPPGQLPPKGMCRVWIDGVPPGQQPPVTDCATAERNRVVNSRVIYGDRDSFPGRGRGKFETRSENEGTRGCTTRDAVVINGRVVDPCRDDTVNRKRGRKARDDDEDDDDDRNDRIENRGDDEDRGKARRDDDDDEDRVRARRDDDEDRRNARRDDDEDRRGNSHRGRSGKKHKHGEHDDDDRN